MMDGVKLTISLDLVEELFCNSSQTREYEGSHTLITELKSFMEQNMTMNLLLGHHVSLQDSFENAVNELIFDDDMSLSL